MMVTLMHVEFACLGLTGFLFLILSIVKPLDILFSFGIKALYVPSIAVNGHNSEWAKKLLSIHMSFMSLIMSFFIPIAILNVLGMREYHFLLPWTKIVAILFALSTYGYVACIVFSFHRVAIYLQHVCYLICFFLFSLIGYLMVFG